MIKNHLFDQRAWLLVGIVMFIFTFIDSTLQEATKMSELSVVGKIFLVILFIAFGMMMFGSIIKKILKKWHTLKDLKRQ